MRSFRQSVLANQWDYSYYNRGTLRKLHCANKYGFKYIWSGAWCCKALYFCHIVKRYCNRRHFHFHDNDTWQMWNQIGVTKGNFAALDGENARDNLPFAYEFFLSCVRKGSKELGTLQSRENIFIYNLHILKFLSKINHFFFVRILAVQWNIFQWNLNKKPPFLFADAIILINLLFVP